MGTGMGMGDIDIKAKLETRRLQAQKAAQREGNLDVALPHRCPMCGMPTALLVQCSICTEEGCNGVCIPSGDRTPCLTCDAQTEMSTPVGDEELALALPTATSPEDEEELDRLRALWAEGEQLDDGFVYESHGKDESNETD